MTYFAFSCLSHHRGVSGYEGTPSSPAVDAHTEHRVLSLALDDRTNVPPPPDPGDLAGKYGVQAVSRVIPCGSNSADGQNPTGLGLYRRLSHAALTLLTDRPPPGDSTLGTLSQDRAPRSESKCPVERPSSCDTGHNARLATKGSVQQSPVNRPVYSEHAPVTPGPGKPGKGPLTCTRYPVLGSTDHTG